MVSQKFAHIGLSCRNPIVTEEFYTRHFGFRRARVVGAGDDQVVFLKTESGEPYQHPTRRGFT